MAFASKSVKEEDLKQGSTGYINGSGIYPVNLLAAFVDTSEQGSSVVNFYLDHEGQEQVLYGNLRVTNKEGAENAIGMKVFNQLLVIADLDEVNDPEEGTLPIGKDGADKDVAVLEDIADIDVLIRIQMEYSVYRGDIQEKKVIKNFYRAGDNASAQEVVTGDNIGSAFEKDQKYINNVTYKDDLTEESVAAWIAGGRKKGTGGSSPAAVAPTFGKKPKFAKKK